MFLFNNKLLLWAQYFYDVIVDEAAGWINYHFDIEIESE